MTKAKQAGGRHLRGWSRGMSLILVVEDEDQVRLLAENILQAHGHLP